MISADLIEMWKVLLLILEKMIELPILPKVQEAVLKFLF